MLGPRGFGGGNGPVKRGASNTSYGTRSVSATPLRDSSPEAKAAKAFFQAMNVLTFDPAKFALIFIRADLAIQKRALATLIAMIDILAARWDNAHYHNDEEMEFVIAAKRAQDAIAPFRELDLM